MLAGEHAVVYDHCSIVAAVNAHAHMEIEPLSDNTCRIESSLGNYESNIKKLEDDKRFRFLISAINSFDLSYGLKLKVYTDFEQKLGLGSSAAVTAAAVAALYYLKHREELNADLLFDYAYRIIYDVQGSGSCADLAASVYGGVLAYRRKPRRIMPLIQRPSLFACYSGHKVSTTPILVQVNNRLKRKPIRTKRIFNQLDKSSQSFEIAWTESNWSICAFEMEQQQKLLTKLGVDSPELIQARKKLRSTPGVLATKLSGAGIGDCVIGIGEAGSNDSLPNCHQLGEDLTQPWKIEIADKGIILDVIN